MLLATFTNSTSARIDSPRSRATMSSKLESKKLMDSARTPSSELREWLNIKRERYLHAIKSFDEDDLKLLLGNLELLIFKI